MRSAKNVKTANGENGMAAAALNRAAAIERQRSAAGGGGRKKMAASAYAMKRLSQLKKEMK
jgi:hypothetical protein